MDTEHRNKPYMSLFGCRANLPAARENFDYYMNHLEEIG